MIRHPLYHISTKLSWLDIRVFYIRISNFTVDDSTSESLTLNHIPLSPDSLLEVNGERYSIDSGASCVLRRNRADKKSEEATFVSTDSVRLTEGVKFEVFHKEGLVISGVLEMSSRNGFVGESKGNTRRWHMSCEAMMGGSLGFLKGKQIMGSETLCPTIEVYIAGCFSGSAVILTKTLQLNHRKKNNRRGVLDSIPEYEPRETETDDESDLDLQVAEYGNYKTETEEEMKNIYWRRAVYKDGEDGELSWFNSGVRVGVGISLGICLGIGIGVGLLVRTYQSTTRNFRRRFV